jgi:uncharacterized protein YndB with AHSA1/START domain
VERSPVTKIEHAIVIGRPVEEVWEFISDLRHDPQWCDKVMSVDQVAGDGPGAGSSYRVVHRPVRLKEAKELAVRVEEFEPPRGMRLSEQDDDAVFDVTYELEGAEEGTRLTQRDQIEWTIPKFQQPIGRAMVSRDIRRQFSTLKRLLEARAATRAGG